MQLSAAAWAVDTGLLTETILGGPPFGADTVILTPAVLSGHVTGLEAAAADCPPRRTIARGIAAQTKSPAADNVTGFLDTGKPFARD